MTPVWIYLFPYLDFEGVVFFKLKPRIFTPSWSNVGKLHAKTWKILPIYQK